jgi:hypothetical protein
LPSQLFFPSPLKSNTTDIPTGGKEQNMAPKSNKSFAKATTKFGLATVIAALWMTAVPITGAVADVQISAARAQAIQQCNRLAARYPLHDWGNTQIHLYRSCMAQRGQQE